MNTTTDTAPQLSEQNTKEKIFKILNLSVPILMGILIFFNPFPHTTAIKEICFYGSVIIVLILTCFKKIDFSFKSPLALPFALFIIWVFIGLFFAIDKENSIHDFFSHLLRYIIFYYILINYFNSKKLLGCLSWIIIISATIFCLGGLYYFYFILGNAVSARFAAGFPETPINVVNVSLIFALLLSFHNFTRENDHKKKSVVVICVFIMFSTMVLTQTRYALVAIILSLFFLLWKHRGMLIFVILTLAITVYMAPVKNRLSLNDYGTKLRICQYSISYEVAKDYPLAGIGFGANTYIKHIDEKKYQNRVPKNCKCGVLGSPHSLYSDILLRTGFVGIFLFFYIIFTSVRVCWLTIKNSDDDFIKNWSRCIASVWIGIIVIGFFEPFFRHNLEVILYTLLAMTTILWHLNLRAS
nr:O-antigen ligase family protein [Bacteroidota bacterium]